MKQFIAVILLLLYYDTVAQPNTLQVIFQDPNQQFVGVAVSKTGRTFINYPYWSAQPKYSVAEIMEDGTLKPYPDEKWNTWKEGEYGLNKWVCVQSVYVDDENKLWVVDAASPMMKGVYEKSSKVVKIDLTSNTVDRIYSFENITGPTAYLNDIRVNTKEGYAYLTNSSEGSIVVLSLQTGIGYEVLKYHKSTLADSSYVLSISGKPVYDEHNTHLRINSDGIALSKDGAWLFYKPLTDNHLYKISTYDLKNVANSNGDLSANVNYVGSISTTDGMITDREGNLYLGDLENSRIIKYDPVNNTRSVVVSDERLLWPDSYAISEDNELYITTSQIHLMPKYNNGIDMRKTPYKLFKISLNNL